MSYALQSADQTAAFRARVYDALVKVKQELGVDELLLAIDDAKKIASGKVNTYLTTYETKVVEAIEAADTAGDAKVAELSVAADKRSVRNIEKIVALTWKNSYELDMTDLNARMPLAQQIVSKYMANFSVKPSM
jgi:hypothetical protein